MAMMWRSRMFWRLFLVSAVLLLSAIGLLGAAIVNRVEQQFLEQIQGSLRSKAVLVRELVHTQKADAADLQRRVHALGAEIAARITLIAKNGTVLADSHEDPKRMENQGQRPEILAAQENKLGTGTRLSNTLHLWMMYAALRATDPSRTPVFVRVGLKLDNIHEQVAGLHRIVWTAATITALAAMILAFWMARRITRPLQELTAGAKQIAAGKYGQRVYVAGHDEVGTLAQAFNHMSFRLAAQFAQLEEDRQQLRAILSGMIEGVIALDAQQRILFVNERAARLLEFQAPAFVGRKLWEMVRQPALQETVQRAFADSEPCQQELNLTGLGAKSLTVHAARLAGVPDRGIILVLHDTTELRRLERVRQEFVANVSHELKTPLSVIKACIETLLDGAVDDTEHRGAFLERIADQTERLHRLILDLLSLARIESDLEIFEFQNVALGPVVEACLERHRALAEGKVQRLEVCGPAKIIPSLADTDSAAAADITAWADEEAIGQILDNLVENAVKYTPPGGRIAVSWQAADGQVCLEVEDTGIGIAPADLPRIFERFYRVDKARSREMGGTGLGLAIVKHLVQAMHGSVRATSQPGGGTTFSVLLPRSPAR
jgi:two-component system phosphate regulon sensor histidine kinase PhoR